MRAPGGLKSLGSKKFRSSALERSERCFAAGVDEMSLERGVQSTPHGRHSLASLAPQATLRLENSPARATSSIVNVQNNLRRLNGPNPVLSVALFDLTYVGVFFFSLARKATVTSVALLYERGMRVELGEASVSAYTRPKLQTCQPRKTVTKWS